jgi:zeaxanthin glucosyltransferase
VRVEYDHDDAATLWTNQDYESHTASSGSNSTQSAQSCCPLPQLETTQKCHPRTKVTAMSHIGLLTPAYTGHVNTMIALGRELHRRGNQASVISTPDAREAVVRAGLAFISVGESEYPHGSLKQFTAKQGTLTGMRAVHHIIKDLAHITAVHGRELAEAVTSHEIDALVVDQVTPAGGAVAERLDLPFVSVCSLAPLNSEPSIPPWTMPWPYEESPASRRRNEIGNSVRKIVERPLINAGNKYRASLGLPPVTTDGSFSTLAQIAQFPAFFDFPRSQAPECFHYTGPLHDDTGTAPEPFPWDALNDKPLIYATMGTLQNQLRPVFRAIATACADLDAQLIIALGRRGAPIPTDLPGKPLIVDYAPQPELLKRATLTICHGGTNTVLQSLTNGVPMVLLPVATDQPGVSARAKHLGVAEFMPVRNATVRKLRAAVETVWSNPSYRANAQKYQDTIKGLDAVRHAADIVEQAFRTRQPVLSTTAS